MAEILADGIPSRAAPETARTEALPRDDGRRDEPRDPRPFIAPAVRDGASDGRPRPQGFGVPASGRPSRFRHSAARSGLPQAS